MTSTMPRFPDPAAAAPAFHPAEEFLLDYAAGTTSQAETLLLATHLAYCKICRQAVHAARTVGGMLLNTLEPARLPPNMLNRTLAVIETDGPAVAPLPSLSAFLGTQMADRHWRSLPGGFRMHRIPGSEGPARSGSGRAWLFDSSPGMELLPHRHVGDEWTVILSGVFLDGGHAYRAGDFARLDDGEEHRPKIGAEGRCVSLIMVRHAPRYTTAIGKLAAPFLKL
jgi:putative transcriptional regulator